MKNLPEQPNLQFLLREAKALRSAHRNGHQSVCNIIGHFDTSLHGLCEQEIFDTRFSLLDAQRVIARQYGFSSWSRLKKYVERSWQGRTPTDVRLREKLLARYEELQSLQKELQSMHKARLIQNDDRGLQREYEAKYREYRSLAAESTQFMTTAFDCHGWPGPDAIGPDCMWKQIYVSGNAVYNADYQFRSIQLMGDSLPDGGCDAYWYSQFMDRNLVLSKKPTIYGMSFGYYMDDDGHGHCHLYESEVEDPENLDKRRACVGHEAIKVRTEKFIQDAAKEEWENVSYEQCVAEQDKLSIEGGYLQKCLLQ